MTPWQKAKLLRKRAAICPTRTGALKLLIQARHYEKQAGFETPVSATLTAPRVDGDSNQVPRWFREARRKLVCSKCRSTRGCYWYVNDGHNYIRSRIIPAVNAKNYDRVKMLMSTGTVLCRTCKEENK